MVLFATTARAFFTGPHLWLKRLCHLSFVNGLSVWQPIFGHGHDRLGYLQCKFAALGRCPSSDNQACQILFVMQKEVVPKCIFANRDHVSTQYKSYGTVTARVL